MKRVNYAKVNWLDFYNSAYRNIYFIEPTNNSNCIGFCKYYEKNNSYYPNWIDNNNALVILKRLDINIIQELYYNKMVLIKK